MYIAMEYVPGEDLSDRIRRGPLAPRDAVAIAIELCELLCIAQRVTWNGDGRTRQGIVHGDLKPRNLRLVPSGGVKVLDFGIAKALSLTRALTRNEFGSLPYSSPERIETGHVDLHSDLWSVAVVLYEMLTGQQPFRGDSTRRLEHFIRSRSLPEPLPAGCPESLAAVLRKALAPALERRYASAAELRDDLCAFLAGGPTQALADGAAAALYEATRRSPPSTNGVHDTGETRRTLGPVGNGSGSASDTRRTLSAAAAANPAAASPASQPGATVGTPGAPARATAPAPAPSAPFIPFWRRLHVRWRLVALVVTGLLLANEARVMGATGELRSALPRLRRGESESVWRLYSQLRSRSPLGLGTFGLSRDVRDWFVAAADELIADYRSDTPVIRESGWRDASAMLSHAAAIAPRDREIRARLLYCRGQLARINAQAAKARNPADAQPFFNEATSSFEEAARLRPHWLDPNLGLARTYVYGLEEPEQARDALRSAEADGYRLGSRDLALLGDGYRLRAEKAWSHAGDFRDLPQEDRYIASVRDDCEQALQHYEKIPAYGEVSRNTRKVQELLRSAETRENDLRRARFRKSGLGVLAPFLGVKT